MRDWKLVTGEACSCALSVTSVPSVTLLQSRRFSHGFSVTFSQRDGMGDIGEVTGFQVRGEALPHPAPRGHGRVARIHADQADAAQEERQDRRFELDAAG